MTRVDFLSGEDRIAQIMAKGNAAVSSAFQRNPVEIGNALAGGKPYTQKIGNAEVTIYRQDAKDNNIKDLDTHHGKKRNNFNLDNVG